MLTWHEVDSDDDEDDEREVRACVGVMTPTSRIASAASALTSDTVDH